MIIPAASCGVIPHTHTGYDTEANGQRIQGLETSTWANIVQSGPPKTRSTTSPSTLTLPAGSSAQLTGEVALPASASPYTFSASVPDVANDGVRVFVDGQSVLDRWTTLPRAIMDDQPTNYWRFGDHAPSTTATAQVGAAANAPDVLFDQTGPGWTDKSTGAETTGGGDSYISPPNGAITATTTPTIEMWFKTSKPGALFGYQSAQPMGSLSNYVPALYVGADGLLNGEFWNGGVGPIQTTFQVDDNNWHHVVLTTSTTNQSMYVDGNLIGARSGAAAALNMTTSQFGLAGVRGWPDAPGVPGPAGWWGCVCSFADAAIYTHPLTAAQVATHYQTDAATLTGTVTRTFSAAAPVASGSSPAAPASTPLTIRVDYRDPASALSAGGLTISATSNGVTTPIAGGSLDPRYGLATLSVTGDSGGLPSGSETKDTLYDGSNLDPVYGLATDSIVDPGGLNLDTKTAYEAPGTAYLRETASALPSASITTRPRTRRRATTAARTRCRTRACPARPRLLRPA